MMNRRSSRLASRSAGPRTVTPRRRRRSRPKPGAGRPARSMTAVTTRLATASRTSTGTCLVTTCGRSPAPSPTSRHPRTNCGESLGSRRAQNNRGRQDPSFPDPASVEAADLAAVDDQTIARQQGREGPVLWVEEDLNLLVVEPLAGQWEPGFVHRLLGAEQQPVPVRAVRLQLSNGGKAIM